MVVKKYYDTESEEVFTEDQIYAFWVQSEKLDFPDFEKWLKEVTGPNGTLKEMPSDWELENKRRWTAVKVAANTGYDYLKVLEILREINAHGNWTAEEIASRPVDIEEMSEIVSEEMERGR